jgi:apolipoprotein N-acyltransferase
MGSSLTLGISAAQVEVTDPLTGRFAIINNRKRAIIALIHSVFFLGVAGIQLAVSHATPLSLHQGKVLGGVILLGIYVIVTTILLILLRYSRCTKERLYFALCSASAAFGLVRILLGDPVLHANILRVLLLLTAVMVGTGILRAHSSKTGSGERDLP